MIGYHDEDTAGCGTKMLNVVMGSARGSGLCFAAAGIGQPPATPLAEQRRIAKRLSHSIRDFFLDAHTREEICDDG